MKKRKMALVVSAMVVALAGLEQAAFAQSGQGMGGGQTAGQGQTRARGAAGRLAKMTTRLSLTEAQQSQVKPILEDEETQLKAVKADTTLSRVQKRDKAREIRQASYEKIKLVLTPEQLQKEEEIRGKAKARWEERRKRTPKGAEQ